MLHRLVLASLLLTAIVSAQPQELPRFRAGANLVRVDAYVSKDDLALTDLKAEDFLVFEDDKPQQVESFELVEARRPNAQTERTDPTNVRDMQQQLTDAKRVFTLYFDNMRVSVSGSYRAQKPIVDMLDRVIGPDDLVGVMTPQMSPSSVTYSPRTSGIERIVTDTWDWGKRDSVVVQSRQEEAFVSCYGVEKARPFIARMRVEDTLQSLDALVGYLDTMRPERKFVLVFTEGWPLSRAAPGLLESIPGTAVQDPLGTDPRTGGLRKPGSIDSTTGVMSMETCNREATRLAYSDHEFEFRQLLQKANRANVSFYPIDARGLVAFDTPIEWGVPPGVDRAWLTDRYEGLRNMAEQTDGFAILNTNDTAGALRKVFADIGSYYLLGYYSTNQKLDGRFRRIRVEVKRPDVTVRARNGYLAPTESEARAAGASIERAGAKPALPPTVTRALDAIAPARGNLPARLQAIGGRNTIHAIVELDPVTAKQPEWVAGGSVKLTFEPERPSSGAAASGTAAQAMTVAIEPGQRSIAIDGTPQPLTPGRYSVRAELQPRNSRVPIQVTTFVTVPADSAEVASGGLALRRGPSTGLAYIATADPRFRRTERIRFEVPLAGDGFTGSGRLLTREGQPMPLIVSYSTRTDEGSRQQFGVADLTLAPLAAGDYVLEVTLTKNGKPEVVTYGFRIVP